MGLPPRSLQNISQLLGQPTDPNNLMEEILSGGGRRAAAENALLDYCEQQPAIKLLLKESKVSRHDLQELYYQLVAVGAGQWVGGHWVAASALAYPEALRYALGQRGKNMQKAAFNLIMYFERGSALEGGLKPVRQRLANKAINRTRKKR